MNKSLKRLSIVGVVVLCVMFLFGGCGESPVAKVHMKEYLATWAPGAGEYYISWVDVLEVYDEDEFSTVAEKISEDGKRANLPKVEKHGNTSEDGIYYVYPSDRYLQPSRKLYVAENVFCWLFFTLVISLFPAIAKTKEG